MNAWGHFIGNESRSRHEKFNSDHSNIVERFQKRADIFLRSVGKLSIWIARCRCLTLPENSMAMFILSQGIEQNGCSVSRISHSDRNHGDLCRKIHERLENAGHSAKFVPCSSHGYSIIAICSQNALTFTVISEPSSFENRRKRNFAHSGVDFVCRRNPDEVLDWYRQISKCRLFCNTILRNRQRARSWSKYQSLREPLRSFGGNIFEFVCRK